jgi:hypothetical protein
MSAAHVKSRQGLVQLWVVQLVGTVVLCGMVYLFMRSGNYQLGTLDDAWKRYLMLGVLGSAAPAMLYLRHYKALLLQDLRLERERGSPDPRARTLLTKSLALGSALCELPMVIGVGQLLFGGEMRWFLGATMVTLAVRLSYRPFMKPAAKA